MARSRLEQNTASDPGVQDSAEVGRTALGVRDGAPGWLQPLLYGVLVVGVLFILISLVAGWTSFFLLLGLVVAVAGLGLAVNPGSSSPAGGIEERG